MEGAHISHDTVIGNGSVFGYGTKIAGDCVIGNGVIYSTSVVENAKTRVGDLAMIQAGTTFSKDIPPYIIAGGKPVKYAGPNTIIMEGSRAYREGSQAYCECLPFGIPWSDIPLRCHQPDQGSGARWSGDSEHHPVPGEFREGCHHQVVRFVRD